jgi:hypothetical protein
VPHFGRTIWAKPRAMLLTAGSRLGPYEVACPLGTGSMGEVYRARDPRLGRDVAVKVIAADGQSSPDRLRRFEQEARAVAALDHPNILSVHDVGAQDGTTYVVFELLEGETLRARLDRAPIPTRKAAELAVQVCAGLAAAHGRGITHRDLKPENLFLTRDGRVKILDFGLAKLTEPLGDGLEEARTRTRTDQGTWLGTAGYVSPEQVREGRADARSDVFALGAILYEMLAGRRAFRGRTAVDTLSAILNSDPPPITSSAGPVPKGLETVVRRCMEKDPEERFQSARDVGFAMEALSGESHPGTDSVAVMAQPRRRWVIVGAPILAILAVAALAGLFSRQTVRQGPLPQIKQLTFGRGMVDSARFTSDGRTVVYSAIWDGHLPEVFSTRVEGPESRSLGLPPAQVASVSSQGELAILMPRPGDFGFNTTSTLARVPLSGSAPRQILDNVLAADWSPDGRELAVIRVVKGDYQLEYPIGNVLANPAVAMAVRVSPRGDRVAVPSVLGSEIHVYDRAGKKTILKTPPAVVALAWAPDDAIWFSAGDSFDRLSLWRATLDGTAREVYRAPGRMSVLDVSPDGRILVNHGTGNQTVRVKVPGEPNERELSVFSWSQVTDLSRDGTQLLISEIAGTAESGAAFLQSTRGGPPVRLGEGRPLALSPDAKWALILSEQAKHPRLILSPTAAGEPRVLPSGQLGGVGSAWFRDERHILLQAYDPGRPTRMFLLDTSGGEPRPVTPEVTFGIRDSATEGPLIAWTGQGGTLARYPLTGGAPEPIPARPPSDTFPIRVTADGRAVLIAHGDIPKRIDRFDLATGQLIAWNAFRPDDLTGVTWVCGPVIPANGEAYAYNYARFLMNAYVVEGLR